jgi:two-component system OmpR family response regulator
MPDRPATSAGTSIGGTGNDHFSRVLQSVTGRAGGYRLELPCVRPLRMKLSPIPPPSRRDVTDASGLDGGAHLLVVDDDPEIRDLLVRLLRKHGYRVTSSRNGIEMREILATAGIDLVVLDIMMPGEDGLTLCREIRAQSDLPVIMLTAMGEEMDRIVGLEMGADDYLAKPFSPRELLARVKAVLRRTSSSSPSRERRGGRMFVFARWRLDTHRRELTSPDGVVIDLSAGEYDLLLALIEHPQRILTRDQLLDMARNRVGQPYDRSIDVQVSRLRRKLGSADPLGADLIKTVRGAGYLFLPTVERP